jgi:hypothetical protein
MSFATINLLTRVDSRVAASLIDVSGRRATSASATPLDMQLIRRLEVCQSFFSLREGVELASGCLPTGWMQNCDHCPSRLVRVECAMLMKMELCPRSLIISYTLTRSRFFTDIHKEHVLKDATPLAAAIQASRDERNNH